MNNKLLRKNQISKNELFDYIQDYNSKNNTAVEYYNLDLDDHLFYYIDGTVIEDAFKEGTNVRITCIDSEDGYFDELMRDNVLYFSSTIDDENNGCIDIEKYCYYNTILSAVMIEMPNGEKIFALIEQLEYYYFFECDNELLSRYDVATLVFDDEKSLMKKFNALKKLMIPSFEEEIDIMRNKIKNNYSQLNINIIPTRCYSGPCDEFSNITIQERIAIFCENKESNNKVSNSIRILDNVSLSELNDNLFNKITYFINTYKNNDNIIIYSVELVEYEVYHDEFKKMEYIEDEPLVYNIKYAKEGHIYYVKLTLYDDNNLLNYLISITS